MAAGTGVCRKRTGSGTAPEGGEAQDRRADAHGRQARAWEHAGATEGCRPEGQRRDKEDREGRGRPASPAEPQGRFDGFYGIHAVDGVRGDGERRDRQRKRKEKAMSEVQNRQRGGQQQAQEAAGRAQDAGQITDQVGQVTEQAQDAAGQAQDVAGQVTDQAGQVVGQTQDAAGGLIGGGQGDGRSGEQGMDDYSYSDSDATTVENDKTPKGILGQLLNLDILPPPQSDTTSLESGDSAEYAGPEEAQQEEAQG